MKHLFECKMKCRLPQLVDQVVESVGQTSKINHVERADLPSRKVLLSILEDLHALLFPGFIRRNLCNANLKYFVGDQVDSLFMRLREEVSRALLHERGRDKETQPATEEECETEAEGMAIAFLQQLPEVRRLCETDVDAAFDGDPAAKSHAEVVFSYPGFHTIATYRLAHQMHEVGIPLIPRFLSEHAHSETGIDIHPGAQIGEGFFIDHGTGVVIGETTIMGKRVQLYHGVTLGAFSPRKGQELRGKKRHPTIEDNVTIYPNATILGGDTVVGRGSVIGGNVWLTKSVPPDSRVLMEQPEPKIIQKDR